LGQVDHVDLMHDLGGTLVGTPVADVTYTVDGKIECINRTQNDVNTAYGYDELQRLNVIDTEGIGGSSFGFDRFFEYDDLGRITSIFNGTDSSGKRIGDFSGGYDVFGRLKGGIVDTVKKGMNTRSLSYGYDAVGNRLSRVVVNEHSVPPSEVSNDSYVYVQGTNRLWRVYHNDDDVDGFTEYGYDGNGNVNRSVDAVEPLPVHDAWMDAVGTVYESPVLVVKQNYQGSYNSRAFLKFNLSGINLAGVSSATLLLHKIDDDGEGGAPTLYILDSDYGTLGIEDWSSSGVLIGTIGLGPDEEVEAVDIPVSELDAGLNAFRVNEGSWGSTRWMFSSSDCSIDLFKPKLRLEMTDSEMVFVYDCYGNLVSVDRSDGGVESYRYNGDGLRVQRVERVGKEFVYIFDGSDVCFDRRVNFKIGDVTDDGGITASDYVYLLSYLFRGGPAPDPLCVADVNGDGQVGPGDLTYLLNYLYRGGPEPVPNPGCSINMSYVRVGGVRLLELRDGDLGRVVYPLTDQIGSSSVIVDADGVEIARKEYYPFGMSFYEEDMGKVRYQFTGKENDASTGLYYYGARFYNPELGRFVARDVVDDGPSPYVYVGNNPLIAVDPSGNQGVDLWDIAKFHYELVNEKFPLEKVLLKEGYSLGNCAVEAFLNAYEAQQAGYLAKVHIYWIYDEDRIEYLGHAASRVKNQMTGVVEYMDEGMVFESARAHLEHMKEKYAGKVVGTQEILTLDEYTTKMKIRPEFRIDWLMHGTDLTKPPTGGRFSIKLRSIINTPTVKGLKAVPGLVGWIPGVISWGYNYYMGHHTGDPRYFTEANLDAFGLIPAYGDASDFIRFLVDYLPYDPEKDIWRYGTSMVQ
jgi:RHS repeat-associated protein